MKNKIIIGFLSFSMVFVFGGFAHAELTVTPVTTMSVAGEESTEPAQEEEKTMEQTMEQSQEQAQEQEQTMEQNQEQKQERTQKQAREKAMNGEGNAKMEAGMRMDINDNGIPDGQEDFDGDGILNKDDVDYLKEHAKNQAERIKKLMEESKNPEAMKKIKYALKNQKRKALRKGEALVENQKLYKRLKGRILLKVQDKGRAFYVNPETETLMSLGRPADAFAVMREEGLGVSNADLESWHGKAPKRLAGRILLQVQDKGQAYYVDPETLELKYLKRPADAFKIMRGEGLGISNTDFDSLLGVDSSQE